MIVQALIFRYLLIDDTMTVHPLLWYLLIGDNMTVQPLVFRYLLIGDAYYDFPTITLLPNY